MIFKAWKKIPKKPDPEKEKALQNEPLEKGDRAAMLLSAFFTLFLPAVGVLIAVCGLTLLLFSLGNC